MATGPLGVTPAALLKAVAGSGSSQAELALSLRVPRLLAALACGAALAGAGAAFQILFRNPLASPDLLGVTSGAGLGAATALLLGAGAWIVQSAAFAGGLATGAPRYGPVQGGGHAQRNARKDSASPHTDQLNRTWRQYLQ